MQSKFFSSLPPASLLFSDPSLFIRTISRDDDWLSEEAAARYDRLDPLKYTAGLFGIGDITPFAGHSLGPVFKPVLERIAEITALQKQKLHGGHFPGSGSAGNWFDCDIDPDSIKAAKSILGFRHDEEFVFSATGLSANLAMLMDTFYRPSLRDWLAGKAKIAFLDTEFFSDQSIIQSILQRTENLANDFGFKGSIGSQALNLKPNEQGLYDSASMVKTIKEHAHEIKIIHLSDIVFSTGQRLDIPGILSELRDVIEKYNIIVGLDLAHTVGNRPIDLSKLPVTYAVGCAYKHMSGFAGSGFGFYVNSNADLEKFKPVQGWKAANSNEVFPKINSFDPSIMKTRGAQAFRTSNTSAVALAPAQVYTCVMHHIGFEKLFAKSECLTRYLIAQLQKNLGDKIQFVTPLAPEQRGATIVIRVPNVTDVSKIEEELKAASDLGQFEIDTRPPNNIRLTAHYGYTSFGDIYHMVLKLEKVISMQLAIDDGYSSRMVARL